MHQGLVCLVLQGKDAGRRRQHRRGTCGLTVNWPNTMANMGNAAPETVGGQVCWVILPSKPHAYSCTAEMVQLDGAHGTLVPACMRLTIGNRPNSAQSHEDCVEVVRLRI